MLIYTLLNFNTSELGTVANYYPRILVSHADLGKELKKLGQLKLINGFSFGDAGITAYHSELNALDNVGLGSSKLTHEGLNYELIESYDLDLILFYSSPTGINKDVYFQGTLYDWAQIKGFIEICSISMTGEYFIDIYAKQSYQNLEELCLTSEIINKTNNRDYFRTHWYKPPWYFWRE